MNPAWRRLGLLALGTIFVVAALGKFEQPRAFLRAVNEFGLLPLPAVYAVASTLPGVELLAGIVMLVGVFASGRRETSRPALFADAAAWIAAGLLAAFTVLLVVNLVRGIEMDCGCFDLIGSRVPLLQGSRVTWATVFRDLVMLALAYPILRRPA